MSEQERFETWAIVELMGHQRMAGMVSDAVIAGGAFIRVDVPATDDAAGFTRYLAPGAIYAINPCTEKIAKAAAVRFRPKPVEAWDLPRQIAAGTSDEPPFDEDADYYDAS